MTIWVGASTEERISIDHLVISFFQLFNFWPTQDFPTKSKNALSASFKFICPFKCFSLKLNILKVQKKPIKRSLLRVHLNQIIVKISRCQLRLIFYWSLFQSGLLWFFQIWANLFIKRTDLAAHFINKLLKIRPIAYLLNKILKPSLHCNCKIHCLALDGFDLSKTVHKLSSNKRNITAIQISRQEKYLFLREKKSELCFKTGAAGWEARTLPLCYAAPLHTHLLYILVK